jgi:hypothetical protein
VAQDEAHVSVGGLFGACLFREGSLFWAQAYFWRKICFGERPNFGKEDLILEHAQEVARKKHV